MSQTTDKAGNLTFRVPPGPPSRFLLGNALELRRDACSFVLDLRHRYGDIVRYQVLRSPMYMVCHPDYIKHVLQDNHQNYGKESFAYRAIRLVLGNGLLTSQGDFWLRQRRLAQPAFHRQRIAGFGNIITEDTLDLLQDWKPYATKAQAFDVAPEMMRLTLRVIGKSLFNIDLTKEAGEMGSALEAALDQLTSRTLNPITLPLWIPTPGNQRFQKDLQRMEKIVLEIIAEHRRAEEDCGDLLSMFIQAEDEDTGEHMNDQQLRDEVLTMLLAGHETTGNALTWTWYLLSQHPEVEAKLAAELAQVIGDRVPTVDDLPQLQYTEMILQESMRLYPPVYSFHRSAMVEDEIGGYPIPPGQAISICPYVLHRHPEYWPDAETFDPERFTPERVAERHRFAYVPFAAGPRFCIGKSVALTEMKLVVATIAQRYRLRLVPGEVVVPQPALTLRPRDGVRVTLEPVKLD